MAKRIIGDTHSSDDILFFCMGSLHGNETEGYQALSIVFEQIEKFHVPIKGHFFSILGNKRAYQVGKRYIDQDMNRTWRQDYIQEAVHNNRKKFVEDAEVREVFELFEQLDTSRYGRSVFMDLHTTSGSDGLFAVTTETSQNLPLEVLDAPIIYGLNTVLHGTTTEYLDTKGFETFAFEGGQIGRPESVFNLVDAVWRMLLALGMVDEMDIPAVSKYRSNLGYLLTQDVPQHLKLNYIYHIKPNEKYQTVPNLTNFYKVEEGEVIAYNQDGEVKSPLEGYLLMPLYQLHGTDGFFIVQDMKKLRTNHT